MIHLSDQENLVRTMHMMGRHLQPDYFITPSIDALDIDEEDMELYRKFVDINAKKLDAMWADFLEEEAYDRLLARKPSLRTKIDNTPLSKRTKNALKRNYIDTIEQIVLHSSKDLMLFPGIGEKSVREICDYLKGTGLVRLHVPE